MNEPSDIYKAPSDGEDRPPARSTVARSFSLGITVLTVCLAASALLMRAEHWTAERTFGSSYGSGFYVHALSAMSLVVGISCAAAHLAALPETEQPRDSVPGLVGVATWALGAGAIVIGPFWRGAPEALRTMAFSSAALAPAATAIHVAAAARKATAGRIIAATTAFGLVLLSLALAAVAADSALGNRGYSSRLTGGVVAAGLFAIASAWFTLRRHHDPIVRMLIRGGIYPGLALALAARLGAGAAPNGPDTYLMLAAVHSAGAVILFTWLAAVAMRSVEVTASGPAGRGKRVAVGLMCAGAHATTVSIFFIGMRGMPRRYDAYLEVFEGSHRLMSVAVAVSTVGALLLVATLALPRARA